MPEAFAVNDKGLPESVFRLRKRLYIIVGWEVDERESAEHAASIFQKAHLREGIAAKDLVLHSDNGAPMKGATMLATLQRLGVVPSFSRPSVSDDTPYSEALFKTLKDCPHFPTKPFESIAEARKHQPATTGDPACTRKAGV